MRKFLLSLAATGAALIVASPAAAQYYPAQPYGYGYGAYGNDDYGQVRALHARINRIEWRINRLDRYNAVPGGMADRLRYEARRLEYRLNSAARYGLNPYEANDIQLRIARLEQRVQYASANRYGRYGNGYGYDRSNGYGYYDRGSGRGHWDGDRDDDDHGDD
jgi:hypothetical protein